jgi:hypothetical protein
MRLPRFAPKKIHGTQFVLGAESTPETQCGWKITSIKKYWVPQGNLAISKLALN